MSCRPDSEFLRGLKGKKIILVGPAGYMKGSGMGKEIDEYDLIVRMNLSCPVPEDMKADIGSRTDILYHLILRRRHINARPDLFKWHTRDEIRSWKADGVKWVVLKASRDDADVKRFMPVIGDIIAYCCVKKATMDVIKLKAGTGPNMGPIAMFHLLQGEPEKLHVVGCDFHQTGYHVGYGGFNEEQAKAGICPDFKMNKCWGQGRNVMGKLKLHNIPAQMMFLYKMRHHYPNFTTDEVLGELIDRAIKW